MKLSTSLQRFIVLVLVSSIALAACTPQQSNPAPVVTVAQATFTPAPATNTPVPTPVPPTATATPTVEPTSTVTPTAQVPPQVTAKDLVNVRSGPGTGYQLLGQLTAGQTVEALGRNAEGTWWQIAYSDAPDGKGWVLGEYVTPNDQTERLPVVTPAPAPTSPPASTRPAPPPAPTVTSAPSMVYGKPVLVSPADEAQIKPREVTIILTWDPVGALRSGDCYKVRIKHADGVYDTDCLTDTSWTVQDWLFDHRPADRALLWSVRVVDANGNQVSPWSDTWTFYWFGG